VAVVRAPAKLLDEVLAHDMPSTKGRPRGSAGPWDARRPEPWDP